MEPDHGWPLAAVYSLRGSSLATGLILPLLLSAIHLAPALLVLMAYTLIYPMISGIQPTLKYVGAAVLLILALKYWFERVERGRSPLGGDGGSGAMSLLHLFLIVFMLGFIHHEPYILIALIISSESPLTFIIVYLLSVSLGMTIATLLSLKIITMPRIYSWLMGRVNVIPKMGAIILVLMALSLLL